MAVEDINKRVRAMSEKEVEKGQEMQEIQKSQAELLNINNERRNNLNTARVESAMEAENNQNLAQAATMMAAGLGGGMALQQQVQGFNPQTQALLGSPIILSSHPAQDISKKIQQRCLHQSHQ